MSKPEKVYGSERFIGLTRKVGERPPERFKPSEKKPGEFVFIGGKLVEVE